MRQLAPVLFLAAPLLSGCFTYAPVEPAAVSPDMAVRVRLTADASRRLEATRDPDTPIEGRVFEVGNDQFRVLPELSMGGSTEPVSFVFSDLRLVEHRVLSPTKTWLTIGVGTTAGVLLLLSLDALPFGSSGGSDPGDFLSPVLRIPFGS